MFWFIKKFLLTYRHEGVVALPAARALPNDESILTPTPAEKEEDFDSPYTVPRNRKGVIEAYGDCGISKLDSKWERANMVLVKGLPGRWNKGRGRMYCHHKAAPALREALRRCEEYGVLDYIGRMGCFKWRHIQHNSSKPLSYHSWGIAFDINPPNNRLKRYKRGTAPETHSEEWWEIWPKGVPELLVQAFEEAGFSWGGEWKTVPDPMHFELVAK